AQLELVGTVDHRANLLLRMLVHRRHRVRLHGDEAEGHIPAEHRPQDEPGFEVEPEQVAFDVEIPWLVAGFRRSVGSSTEVLDGSLFGHRALLSSSRCVKLPDPSSTARRTVRARTRSSRTG